MLFVYRKRLAETFLRALPTAVNYKRETRFTLYRLLYRMWFTSGISLLRYYEDRTYWLIVTFRQGGKSVSIIVIYMSLKYASVTFFQLQITGVSCPTAKATPTPNLYPNLLWLPLVLPFSCLLPITWLLSLYFSTEVQFIYGEKPLVQYHSENKTWPFRSFNYNKIYSIIYLELYI